jgi:predicted RND superfamily exporter protein
MRFFSGVRSDKKKSLASQRTKDKMMGKIEIPKTPDEIYKERFEARMAKLVDEAQKGIKGGFRIPGTKQEEKPKEMSQNAKKMFALLAQKKLEQERKKERKKLVEMKRVEKIKKREEVAKKEALMGTAVVKDMFGNVLEKDMMGNEYIKDIFGNLTPKS